MEAKVNSEKKAKKIKVHEQFKMADVIVKKW